jgi:hypothetical protein
MMREANTKKEAEWHSFKKQIAGNQSGKIVLDIRNFFRACT